MNDKITIRSIAGFCHEGALWKLLEELSSENAIDNTKGWRVPVPDVVIVDGEDFRMDCEGTQNQIPEFFPPEGMQYYGESGFVWSLGALVCYASSGHYIFGGRGGIYQRSDSELPTLRKEHSALTPLVRKCLCYLPSQRISLKELHALAVKGLESSKQRKRVIYNNESSGENIHQGIADDTWPEKMG